MGGRSFEGGIYYYYQYYFFVHSQRWPIGPDINVIYQAANPLLASYNI